MKYTLESLVHGERYGLPYTITVAAMPGDNLLIQIFSARRTLFLVIRMAGWTIIITGYLAK